MAGHYGLDFSIGNTHCQLMHIQQGFSPERSTPYYYHQHLYFEFHYVEKGTTEFLCQEKPLQLQDGQLLIIPPGIYHSMNQQTEEISQISLSISIAPPKPGSSEATLQFYHSLPRDRAMVLTAKHSDLREDLMRLRLLAEDSQPNYLNREKIRALANVFLIDLYELLVDRDNPSFLAEQAPPLSQEYVLDTHFASRFVSHSSSKELADQLHISPRQLHRTIKKKYHMNYREKSKETRVEIATNLLHNSDKSISQIAELLGYSRSANFSCFIKNATGKTPSQIRKEGKMNQ